MKYSTIILDLALCVSVSDAFSPIMSQHTQLTKPKRTQRRTVVLSSSQWDDEEDEQVATQPTSFDDAGAALKQEDEDKAMAGSGDFDTNPQVSFRRLCILFLVECCVVFKRIR